MKLSAFVAVSVPVLAISQSAAVAAEPGATNVWVQDSVAALSAKQLSGYKAPVAQAKHHAASAPVKLRAFKPGRYLPSERDLREALVAQQASYDNSMYQQAGTLNGQVNAYAPAPRPVSMYDQYAMSGGYNTAPQASYAAPRIQAQKRPIARRAPQVVPHRTPIIPEHLALHPGSAPTGMQLIPEPPRGHMPASMPVQQQMPARAFSQSQQMAMPMQQMQPMAQMPMQMPVQMQQQQMMQQPQFQSDFSLEELQELHRRVESNRPTARMTQNGEVVGNPLYAQPQAAAGQMSPLNMYGGNAMQNLTSSQRKANVAPARFGSWHGSSGLPYAGFHSYTQRRKPMMYDYRMAAPAAHSAAKPKPMAAAATKRSAKATTPSVAQKASAPVLVAQYPAYQGNRGSTY